MTQQPSSMLKLCICKCEEMGKLDCNVVVLNQHDLRNLLEGGTSTFFNKREELEL